MKKEKFKNEMLWKVRSLKNTNSASIGTEWYRHYEVKSRCRSAGKATMVNLLTKQYQTSSLSPPWVRNLDFEKSLWNHIHLNHLYVRF